LKILVLGANGQLGQCLKDQFSSTDYQVIFTSKAEIDVSDYNATRKIITQIKPEIVINASAYTAVDNAEKDFTSANKINHLAVDNIAKSVAHINSLLIHVSTDYVFDGNETSPYKEDAATNPQGVYGQTKLLGELAIERSGCKYFIIRTAWIFSEYGHNFLKTMLDLGMERDQLNVVNDQIGCPTYAQDIARSIIYILTKERLEDYEYGIYHYSGNIECSWYEFARYIFLQAKKKNIKTPKKLNPIKTAEYPTMAYRPIYSVLDSGKIYSSFGIEPSEWKKGVEIDIQNLINSTNLK
jgi:dTDP-4-dehydrorhamnose reductase